MEPSWAGYPQQETQQYTTPLEVRTMPDQVAQTLQYLVRQIDVLTQTMSILEVFSRCDYWLHDKAYPVLKLYNIVEPSYNE